MIPKVKLSDLSYKELVEYIETLERQEDDIRSLLKKANFVKLVKAINDSKSRND